MFYFIKIHVINYSYLEFIKFIFVLIIYVKMFISRRQYAWLNNRYYYNYQRLNKNYLDNRNKILFISADPFLVKGCLLDDSLSIAFKVNKRNTSKIFGSPFGCVAAKWRLNPSPLTQKARFFTTKGSQQTQDFILNTENKNKIFFEQWLVGVMDGDGSFSIVHQNNIIYYIIIDLNLSISRRVNCGI